MTQQTGPASVGNQDGNTPTHLDAAITPVIHGDLITIAVEDCTTQFGDAEFANGCRAPATRSRGTPAVVVNDCRAR
jgi:hypothetical protein